MLYRGLAASNPGLPIGLAQSIGGATLDDYASQYTQWLWSKDQAYAATEVLDNTGTKSAGRVIQPGRYYSPLINSGHVAIPGVVSDGLLDGTNAFSLTFWADITDVKSGSSELRWLAGTRDQNGQYFQANFIGTGFGPTYNSFQVVLRRTSGSNELAKRWRIDLLADGFHHFALSYDGSQTAAGLVLYIDGVSASSYYAVDTLSSVITASSDLYLLTRENEIPYSGKSDLDISDVRLFEVGLTALEAEDVFAALIVQNANVRGHWKCDESAGTTAYDSSGNGNHGTITSSDIAAFHGSTVTQYGSDYPNQVGYSDGAGGALVPRDESTPTLDVLGASLDYSGRVAYDADLVASGCGDFDGAGDWVGLGDVANFDRTDVFSISAWCNISSTSLTNFVSRYEEGLNRGWTIVANQTDFNGGLTPGRLFFSNSNDLFGAASAIVVYRDGVLGSQVHVTITYDGSSIASGVTLYVNGAGAALTVQANTLSGTTLNSVNANIASRGDGLGAKANGLIWDVRIWNVELSAAEALSVYQGADVQTANLEGHWPLAEGSGLDVYDVGPGGNHGTLTTSDVTAFRAQRQDQYHYNYRYGFRKSGSVFIPAKLDGLLAADGSAITNPKATTGAWHNASETGIKQPVAPQLYASDASTGFWYTGGAANEKVYADFVEDVNDEAKIMSDVSTANEYKNVLSFEDAPTGADKTTIESLLNHA